jgi:hypothetical protein
LNAWFQLLLSGGERPSHAAKARLRGGIGVKKMFASLSRMTLKERAIPPGALAGRDR